MPDEKPARPKVPRRTRILRFLGLLLLVPILLLILVLLPSRPLPGPLPGHASAPAAEAFDDYVTRKIDKARSEGVRPGNEERFVRRVPGTSNVALLFIHGFGASRAEGEAVVDTLGEELGANVYYMRLPGHGGDMEAHAAVGWEQYLTEVEEAFHHARSLGEHLILIGSSTGGLLCTWLAARHPDDVSGVVLASPFFAFAAKNSFLLSRRAGMTIIEAVYGPIRDASWKKGASRRVLPGYNDHWITKQRFRALLPLDDLRRTLSTDEIFGAVRAPVLLLYHYENEQNQDPVVDVGAMRRAFGKMNGGGPHSLSKEIAIADGNHILFSAYVRTDKPRILAEARSFLKAVTGR